jgi:DNA-binding transcriptional ArsR family regulator
MSDVRRKLMTAKLVLSDARLRTLLGKETQLIEEGNVYGEEVDPEVLHQLLDDVFSDEIARKNILALVEQEPLTVEQLSERIGEPPDQVFRHVLALQKKGLLDVAQVKEHAPVYKRIGSQ